MSTTIVRADDALKYAAAMQRQTGWTLDVIGGTCRNPLATVDATIAAIFRSLGGEHPRTLIIDEADAIFGSKKVAEQNEEICPVCERAPARGDTGVCDFCGVKRQRTNSAVKV